MNSEIFLATMHPGEKIACARKYAAPAMSQEDLARMLDVHRTTVARWESSVSPPRVKVLEVARRLGIEEQWFWVDDDTPPVPAGRERPATTIQPPPSSYPPGSVAILPVWFGMAGDGGECMFHEPEHPELMEVPAFLITGSPEQYVLVKAEGSSMSPRIQHGEIVVVRRETRPPLRAIVVVERAEDNARFIKVLRPGAYPVPYELHPLNDAFAPITDVLGWRFVGVVVAILGHDDEGRNIEYRNGSPLKA